MKKIIWLFVAFVMATATLRPAMAQKSVSSNTPQIPISVYLPEEASSIPASARQSLESKLITATARNGMGATEDFAQFYVTCAATVIDQQVLAGAPTQYRQEVEWNLYVVDAFAKKIFGSTVISTSGVGRSVDKAYMQSLKKISGTDPALSAFFSQINSKIINYYESQCNNIISIAQSLAAVYKYDEALFRLSIFPEACPSYGRIVEVATDIYKKYLEDQAQRNLAQARAIWSAGLDAEAARAAVPFLAEILPDVSCYEEAMELLAEIKQRVKEDIDYIRQIEERNNRQGHELAMARVAAWRDVGIAYGTNQKQTIYRDAWPWD
uniref:hypothetical protein n=1 Tax=Alistipes sp. TaxID=1872444 RepID=UPI0040576586